MDKVKIMNDKAKDFICKHIDSDRIIESVSMTSDFKTHNKEMRTQGDGSVVLTN